MFLQEVNLTKVDANGFEYTSERGFADFCYEYLKGVGAATTGDIIQYIKENFDFLEGDEMKTSEKRSSPRYRQMVDNLLKSHGTILQMYPDLRDFPGGIALDTVVVSDEILERAKGEMSSAAKLAEQRRLEEQKRLREQQKEINERSEIERIAKLNAANWRNEIFQAAMAEGLEKSEIQDDFDDIVKDVAYRHPKSVNDKKSLIEAFINEC